MAGKSRRSKLVLSDEDRMDLERLSRSLTLPHREAQRAAIILGYHGGESIASIGRRLGMTRLSVSKWVAKALAVGPMAALIDNYHRPKEPAIGDDAKAWVVHVHARNRRIWVTRRKFGVGKRWQGMSESMPWRPVFLSCRGQPKRPCIASWRNSHCIRKRSSIIWNGATLILRWERAGCRSFIGMWRCRMPDGPL